MRLARACSLLLWAAAASAQAPVDFDGALGREAFSLPKLERPAAPAPTSVPAALSDAPLPPRAFSRTDRIPELLIAAIDATQNTLRLALYDLTLPDVADAIVRAKVRGVDVKLIYDYGHGTAANSPNPDEQLSLPSPQFTQLVNAGVETRLLKGGPPYGIMHTKIAIFDERLVETGSFNWTINADKNHFENVIFREDPSLAALYAAYWNWMWTPGGPVGAPPSDPAPSLFFKGQAWPRVAFSPGGGIEARLVDAISRCARTLDIAIFSFYSAPIAEAVAAAKERGVRVRVVADASQARRSPVIPLLIQRGVNLLISSGRGGLGVMHHKYALLDGELLAAGSFNFSQNAENSNFENQFYSTDPEDLAAYQEEFEAVFAQARVPDEPQGAGAFLRLSSLR